MTNRYNISNLARLVVLTLSSTALVGTCQAYAAPAASTPATAAPAQVTDDSASTPAAATLQDPSEAAAILDQQTALQGSGDVALTPAASTDTATTPAPALAAKGTPVGGKATTEVVVKNNASETSGDTAASLPTLASVLEQDGIKQDPASDTAQEVAPVNAAPGLDLPLDQDLEASANKTDSQKKNELRQKAFTAAADGMMPLKTDEIRKIMEMYDETQQAVQTPIYPNPKPESTFQTISLAPGTPPIEIKTAMGHVSTLSIVDASGQPWPIQDISWAGNFEVLQPESGSNMLRITPVADFAYGNVSMRLIGLNPPIILTLRTERKSVQVRADIQVPELGPNGVAPPIKRQISTTAGDAKLATILEGVAPESSTKINVAGIDGRTTAYEADGMTYVRTPYTLLSPSWNSSVRSSDGTNVYAMKFTPVLLLSDKGKMVRAQLTKTDMSDEQ